MFLQIKGRNGEVIIEILEIISDDETDGFHGKDIWTTLDIRSGNFTGKGSASFSSLEYSIIL